MFIVTNDPSAADDLVRFLCGHACRATKPSPFVIEVDCSASEGDVEHLLSVWRSLREDVSAELVAPSRRTPSAPRRRLASTTATAPFDWRELANRLGDRGARAVCAACGSRDLEISEEPILLTPGNRDGTPQLDKETGVPLVAPMAAIRCPNCGSVRLHEPGALL